MKSLTDLKKALTTKGNDPITLDQIKEAKAIYTEIAQAGFKTKEWTNTNLALAILTKAFKRFLETAKLDDYRKTIFIADNGYNVVLATEKDGQYENLVSVKIKSEDMIIDLIDNHGFYLVSA